MASAKVTVPKSAKGTRPPLTFTWKSSTTHPSFCPQRAEEEVKYWEMVWPVVRFSVNAVPAVVEEATTVVLIESLARVLMPEKLCW